MHLHRGHETCCPVGLPGGGVRRAVLELAVVPLALAAPSRAATTGFAPPKAGHVWVIELETSFNAAFGQFSTTYQWKTLASQGMRLRQYDGTGHRSLDNDNDNDNDINELSGQALTTVTQSDCQLDKVVLPGAASPLGGGQVVGQCCVYPAAVTTLTNRVGPVRRALKTATCASTRPSTTSTPARPTSYRWSIRRLTPQHVRPIC